MNDDLFDRALFDINNIFAVVRNETLKDGSHIEFGLRLGDEPKNDRRFVIFGDHRKMNLCHVITNGKNQNWLFFIAHVESTKEKFFDYLKRISPAGLEFYIWNLQ